MQASIIEKLFAKSPFGPLIEHAKKVNECIDLILPITEEWFKEEWKQIEKTQQIISETEHQADIIKLKIRRVLPKGHFYPVPRGDLFRVLKNQDNMADFTEDYAILLTLRKTTFPAPLKTDFKIFVNKVVKTCHQSLQSAKELDALLETSFAGPEAQKLHASVEKVGRLEYEVDLSAHSLVKKLLLLENEIPTLNIIFCMNIIQTLSQLCNHAENLGDNLFHMIISRK